MSIMTAHRRNSQGTTDDERYDTGNNVPESLDSMELCPKDQGTVQKQQIISQTHQGTSQENQEYLQVSSPQPFTASAKRTTSGTWTKNNWYYKDVSSDEDMTLTAAPNLERTDLLGKGICTRNMHKSSTDQTTSSITQPSTATPSIAQPLQAIMLQRSGAPKTNRKRKVSSALEASDNDVIPEAVRIIKQTKTQHDKTKARLTTRRIASRPAKRVIKKHKPKSKAKPYEKKAPRAQKQKNTTRQVRMVGKPRGTMDDSQDVPIESEQRKAVDEARHVRAHRRHGKPIDRTEYKRLKDEFYAPFRRAFSMEYFWPNFDPVKAEGYLRLQSNCEARELPAHTMDALDDESQSNELAESPIAREQVPGNVLFVDKIRESLDRDRAPLANGSFSCEEAPVIDTREDGNRVTSSDGEHHHSPPTQDRIDPYQNGGSDYLDPSGVWDLRLPFASNSFNAANLRDKPIKETEDVVESLDNGTLWIRNVVSPARTDKAHIFSDVDGGSNHGSTKHNDADSNDSPPEVDMEAADPQPSWGPESCGYKAKTSCLEEERDYLEQDDNDESEEFLRRREGIIVVNTKQVDEPLLG